MGSQQRGSRCVTSLLVEQTCPSRRHAERLPGELDRRPFAREVHASGRQGWRARGTGGLPGIPRLGGRLAAGPGGAVPGRRGASASELPHWQGPRPSPRAGGHGPGLLALRLLPAGRTQVRSRCRTHRRRAFAGPAVRCRLFDLTWRRSENRRFCKLVAQWRALIDPQWPALLFIAADRAR